MDGRIVMDSMVQLKETVIYQTQIIYQNWGEGRPLYTIKYKGRMLEIDKNETKINNKGMPRSLNEWVEEKPGKYEIIVCIGKVLGRGRIVWDTISRLEGGWWLTIHHWNYLIIT